MSLVVFNPSDDEADQVFKIMQIVRRMKPCGQLRELLADVLKVEAEAQMIAALGGGDGEETV